MKKLSQFSEHLDFANDVLAPSFHFRIEIDINTIYSTLDETNEMIRKDHLVSHI